MQHQPKVLLVEDEGVIAMNLSNKLKRLGFEVTAIADNGADALAAAQENRPDLVMMDIFIKGPMDGIDTAVRLREILDVPVVFLTAHSDEATIERAKQALPCGYLIKPFEEREVKSTIEMALYRHQAQTIQRVQNAAIASSTSAIVIMESRPPSWPVLSCNPSFETFVGESNIDIVGRPFMSLFEIDEDTAEQLVARLRSEQSTQLEFSGARRDGRAYHVHLALSAVEDQAGRITHQIAILSDHTERREKERRQQRQRRLESLGQLAGGIAHDLNNALTPVLMSIEFLRDNYPQESETLDSVEAGTRRSADMVRQLLTFARGSEGQRSLVRSSPLFAEIDQIVRGTFPKNIHWHSRCAEDLPPVLGESTQLHQVLLNLCVNARDAMPEGGALRLDAETVTIDAKAAAQLPEAHPGRYVVWRVSDTGAGIPPEIIDRVFEPFFSTKSLREGTGLGLSTTLGIIRGHDGFVQIESTDVGTTATVYLPVAKETAKTDPASANPSPQEPVHGQGGLILVVDDEPHVRKTARTVLTSCNFEVLTAVDGNEGLSLAADHKDRLQLVVTDLHMPNLDGIGFVRSLTQILPDALIVATSGRFEEPDRQLLKQLGVRTLIDKPFTQQHLMDALSEALAGRAAT